MFYVIDHAASSHNYVVQQKLFFAKNKGLTEQEMNEVPDNNSKNVYLIE
jgi:hypothetical protein